MVSRIVKYKAKDGLSYYTDQGNEYTLNSLFRVPSDFAEDEGTIESVLACVDSVVREETAPCSDKAGTTPRKLVIRRVNGNSFSLVLPVRSNALEAAQCLWDVILATRYRPVCIELIGEHSLNLIEELAPANKDSPSVAPPIAPDAEQGKSTLWYSSVMKEYKADTPFGTNILMPFKSQTNVPDAPYTELQSYFSSCVEPLTTVSCGGATSIEYRRYIPSFITSLTYNQASEQGDQLQTVTVPTIANETEQIKACGQLLAATTSIVCLEYFGESNKKLHKLINK